MSKFNTKELSIEIDTNLDMKGVEKDTEKLASTVSNKMKKIGEGFATFGLAMNGISMGIGLVTKAFDSLLGVFGDMHARMDELHQADLFGVSLESAKKLQSTLSDVKTTFGALKLLTELKMGGFNDKQAQNFGGMINAIAALTGEGKDVIEKGLKVGNITETQLRAIGKTQTDVQLLFQQESNKLGGRSLDALEKARVLTRAWGQELTNADQALGRLGQSNPFDDLKMSLKGVYEELFTQFTPALREMSDWVRKNKGEIVVFAKTSALLIFQLFKGLFISIKSAFNFIDKWFQHFENTANKTSGIVKKIVRVSLAVSTLGISEVIGHQIKTVNGWRKAAKTVAKDFDKSLADVLKKEMVVAKKSEKFKKAWAKKVAKSRRTRAVQQAKLEAAQETGARIKAARTALRNYEETSFDFIARLGAKGASQLVAGAKQTITLYKQFASQDSKFMERKGKAYALMTLALKGGQSAADKLLASEKQKINMLKAGLSLIPAQVKQSQILNIRLNERKQTNAALLTISLAIKALEKSKIPIADKMLVRMIAFKKEMLEQRDLNRELVKIRLASLKIEEKYFLKKQALKNTAAQLAEENKLLGLRRNLAMLRGKEEKSKYDPAKNILLKANTQIQALKLQIKSLSNMAGEMTEKINAKVIQGKSKEMMEGQIKSINIILAKKREEIGLINETTKVQIANISTIGTFMQSVIKKTQNMTQTLGQTLYASFQSGLSGIGGIISSTMEMLVTGVDNVGATVGKMFLDVLASAASQLGAYFIAAGAAQMFIPPYTGAGAIAGGTALLALAGALKGVGSLLTAPSTAPTSANAGKTIAPPVTHTQIPNQKSNERGNTTFFFATSPVGFLAMDERETARKLKGFVKKMGRDGIDILPQKMNARRI